MAGEGSMGRAMRKSGVESGMGCEAQSGLGEGDEDRRRTRARGSVAKQVNVTALDERSA